ncbi:UNKNOWN [Stylonychia lemnae]|uniref:MACPF domain-containing protein n=1 Tax=Stylonychia lemnae TaxID=5949 RepID=A0A078AE01_STYLE|nr:UNKNOWN [Stylonychia lemnae]|eukprot:CDW80430.1 UNKNOWN [Stylonychia lemnae]
MTLTLRDTLSIQLTNTGVHAQIRADNKAESPIAGSLELPYSEGLQLLQGVDSTNYVLKGNPFKLDGSGSKVSSSAVASDTIQRDIVTTTSEYAANLKASADFQFSGWGASVQFNFAMQRDVKFGSNQKLFVAWRKIVNGYDGYQYPPALREAAKTMLAEPRGVEQFASFYGDYYVKGCVNGASMRMVVRTSSASSSSSESLDVSIRAGWNGGFMSVGGGGGFSQALSSSSTTNLESVEIYYSGQDRGSGVRSLSIAKADEELTNFASIAKTGTPLYCILERYDTHPDYIDALAAKARPLAGTQESFNEFLNDILYQKMIRLEVIMQWYLDAGKSQQKILDEADFVRSVVRSRDILEKASVAVRKGATTSVDLLDAQESIDALEQVFFQNGIRDQVLSPTKMVGPLLDSYAPTLTNVLTPSSDTNLAVDTVFKVQDLATTLDFMGSVTLNLAFALQSWDHDTVGQDQKALDLLKRFQATTIYPIGAFLDKSIADNPFPQTSITAAIALLRTLNATVVSAKGVYLEGAFTTVCGAKLADCIKAFLTVCNNASAIFDAIRAPTDSYRWVWQPNGERKDLIPQFNPYVAIMLSSYVNLNWVLGAQARKASLNARAPPAALTTTKKELECAFRSFLDAYQRKFDEIIDFFVYSLKDCFANKDSWCGLGSNQLLVGLKNAYGVNALSTFNGAVGGIGPWRFLSGWSNCPSWGTVLDVGGNWATCTDNVLVRAISREAGAPAEQGGGLARINDCSCASPTPKLAFADCYEQDISLAKLDSWGYCQKPGYFWFGLHSTSPAVFDLDKVKCCKPRYDWQKLTC